MVKSSLFPLYGYNTIRPCPVREDYWYFFLIILSLSTKSVSMKHPLFFLGLLLLTAPLAYGQGSTGELGTPAKRGVHQIGANAGLTTGVGLSYRYWPGRLGVQVSALPQFEFDGSGHYLNGAITGLFLVKDDGWARLFLFSSVFQNRYRYYYSDPNYTEDSLDITTNVGLGFGYDFILGKDLSLGLMSGFGGFDLFDSRFERVGLTVEASLHYRI